MRQVCAWLTLCSGLLLNAQSEDQALFDVLRNIEDLHSIRFSYNPDIISQKTYVFQERESLDSLLADIGQSCALDFLIVDEENIVIRPHVDRYFLNDTIYLSEIPVVTEYLTYGFDKNKEDGSLIIEPLELGVLPGLTEPDVMQSLQMIPGITSPRESTSNLNVRGGTADHNLVLYDKMKMYHQGHLFGMISVFNPYIIDHIDVYRSGTSPEYGDRIAGVIDIQTPDELPERTSGGLGSNMLHSDLFVKTPIIQEKLGILLSGRRALTDLWTSSTYDSYSNKVFQNTRIVETSELVEEEELEIVENSLSFSDLNAKLFWNPAPDHKVHLSTIRISNGLIFETLDMDNETTQKDFALLNSGASIEWNSRWNEHWKSTTDIRYTEYNSENSIIIHSDALILEEQNRNNLIRDFGTTLSTRYTKGNRTWIMGYDYTDYSVEYLLSEYFSDESGYTEFEQTKEGIHALFIEYRDRIDKLKWSSGLRSSYYSQYGKHFLEPRIYAEYLLDDSWRLKSSVEIKNQAISQLVDFDFNEFSNTIWVLAEDEDIPILNSRQASLGFTFEEDDWHVDVEAYAKKVTGLTSFARGFNDRIDEDYTLGSSHVRGVDLLIKKRIHRFRTWFAYSLSRNHLLFSRIQDETFPSNKDQRHILNLAGSYRIKQLQFGLGWRFASGLPFSDPTGLDSYTNELGEVEFELDFDQQNGTRLNDYHRLDASLNYDFYLNDEKTVRARIGASWANIYNRDNYVNKVFELEDHDLELPEIIERSEIGLMSTVDFVFRIWF